ncbi:MAG: protoporphyrinogen oxidase [Acidimicrobiales bacterium]
MVVIGGGIAGLSAAWQLCAEEAGRPRVIVLEAGDRLGGKILTGSLAGTTLELGPDAFLARVPFGVELCRELGLGDELVSPAAGHAYLWTRGRLRRLPEGLVLGVPSDLWAVARSGAVRPADLARAALDLVLPATRVEGDRAVGEIVSARFGRGIQEWLVDPLVGGIHAGRSELLSAAATAPQLDAAARSGRSLLRALRAQAAAARAVPSAATGTNGATTPPPVFLTHPGGLSHLIDTLAQRLAEAGVEIRTGTAVTGLIRSPRGWTVSLGAGGDGGDSTGGDSAGGDSGRSGSATLAADAVIVATPAPAAAALLGPVCPDAAAELGRIEHSSVAVVSLAYAAEDVPGPLDGTGFLVPRPQGRLMTAATWMSAKWPHVSAPGLVFIRASAGRHLDGRAMNLSDAELVGALHAELTEAMGLRRPPGESLVTRWLGAFPQYAVGHLELIDRVEAAVAGLPGLAVAGGAYRGVGIPACIASGRRAADQVGAHLVAFSA